MKTLEAIKKVKEQSKERKFKQTWDISIGLKGLDLRKPENRLNTEFVLPEGRGKEQKVVVIADSIAKEAENHADKVVTKEELESIISDKKKIKKLADSYDRFLCEASLMAQVGKHLGAILGPRGKVPKPMPPRANPEPFIKMAKRTIRISLRDNPVIHISVGTEDMEDEKVVKNIDAVLNFIKEKLPKGQTNIKSAYLKLTMSKPVRLE
ncbi:MAG: 50S ribosomal protein L1 [Candidatus Aenigmatarchaeota archaeon]